MRNWNPISDAFSPNWYSCFQRTYEELKQRSTWSCTRVHSIVFSVPMRNWNSAFPDRLSSPSAVFSVPMRNWNKNKTSNIMVRKSWVFSVPMRNWNLLARHLVYLTLNCFQRTYEELKHIQKFQRIYRPDRFSAYLWGIETSPRSSLRSGWSRFSAYLWGIETAVVPANIWSSSSFQRTYEELKPGFYLFWRVAIHRFQRTYEELKPRAPGRPGVPGKVFSVPMRNWNATR